jgi:hypothetical protein
MRGVGMWVAFAGERQQSTDPGIASVKKYLGCRAGIGIVEPLLR